MRLSCSMMGMVLGVGSLFLLIYVQRSKGNTAAQCAQFGINDMHDWKVKYLEKGKVMSGGYLRFGYWTIGTRDFDAEWIVSIGSRYQVNGYGTEEESVYAFDPAYYDKPCPWPFLLCPNYFYPNNSHPYKGCTFPGHKIQPCVENSLAQIRMYLVKQNGRVLQGWLHVEIELMDPTDEMELIYIQMRDEAFNAIGEFVSPDYHPQAKCTPSRSHLSIPTQHQFYPCSATGLRESKTSAAIMMAKRDFYVQLNKVKDLIHETPISRGVHFLWKMDEYWCSRHQRIQPFAYILTKRNRMKYESDLGKYNTPYGYKTDAVLYQSESRMYRKIPNYWIYPKWMGASDILFKHGSLDCSELAIDDDTGVLTPAALQSWFWKSYNVILNEDNWHPKNRYQIEVYDSDGKFIGGNYGSNLCQADPLHPNQTADTVPAFSGRCSSHFAKDVSRTTYQGCNTNASSREFEGIDMDMFTDYYKNLEDTTKNRTELCDDSIICKAPQQTDINDITQYDRGNITTGNTGRVRVGHNDTRNKAKVAKFWHGRKFHGMLCLLNGMLITPVYILLARYYKESFMTCRCFGTPCWYWVHMGGIITATTLFASGHAAMSPNFAMWGRSEADWTKRHLAVGYLSFSTFGLLLIMSGFRAGLNYKVGGKPARLVSLAVHSALGFIHHFANLAAIVLSTWIPLSPTMNECDPVHGLPVGMGPVALMAVGYVVFDILFHIGLIVLQCVHDRQDKIRRAFQLPIVPFLPFESRSNLQGAGLRKKLFIVYFLVSLAFAFTGASMIAMREVPEGCEIGPMTCKHAFGCSKLAIRYEQWFLRRGGKIDP